MLSASSFFRSGASVAPAARTQSVAVFGSTLSGVVAASTSRADPTREKFPDVLENGEIRRRKEEAVLVALAQKRRNKKKKLAAAYGPEVSPAFEPTSGALSLQFSQPLSCGEDASAMPGAVAGKASSSSTGGSTMSPKALRRERASRAPDKSRDDLHTAQRQDDRMADPSTSRPKTTSPSSASTSGAARPVISPTLGNDILRTLKRLRVAAVKGGGVEHDKNAEVLKEVGVLLNRLVDEYADCKSALDAQNLANLKKKLHEKRARISAELKKRTGTGDDVDYCASETAGTSTTVDPSVTTPTTDKKAAKSKGATRTASSEMEIAPARGRVDAADPARVVCSTPHGRLVLKDGARFVWEHGNAGEALRDQPYDYLQSSSSSSSPEAPAGTCGSASNTGAHNMTANEPTDNGTEPTPSKNTVDGFLSKYGQHLVRTPFGAVTADRYANADEATKAACVPTQGGFAPVPALTPTGKSGQRAVVCSDPKFWYTETGTGVDEAMETVEAASLSRVRVAGTDPVTEGGAGAAVEGSSAECDPADDMENATATSLGPAPTRPSPFSTTVPRQNRIEKEPLPSRSLLAQLQELCFASSALSDRAQQISADGGTPSAQPRTINRQFITQGQKQALHARLEKNKWSIQKLTYLLGTKNPCAVTASTVEECLRSKLQRSKQTDDSSVASRAECEAAHSLLHYAVVAAENNPAGAESQSLRIKWAPQSFYLSNLKATAAGSGLGPNSRIAAALETYGSLGASVPPGSASTVSSLPIAVHACARLVLDHASTWLVEFPAQRRKILEMFAITGYLFPQGVCEANGGKQLRRWPATLMHQACSMAIARDEIGNPLLLSRLLLALCRMNFVTDPAFAVLCDRAGREMGAVTCRATLYDLAMMLANRNFFTERSEDLGLILLADVIRAATPLIEVETPGDLLFKPILWACSSYNHFDEPFLTRVTEKILAADHATTSVGEHQVKAERLPEAGLTSEAAQSARSGDEPSSGRPTSVLDHLTSAELADVFRSFGQLQWRTAACSGRGGGAREAPAAGEGSSGSSAEQATAGSSATVPVPVGPPLPEPTDLPQLTLSIDEKSRAVDLVAEELCKRAPLEFPLLEKILFGLMRMRHENVPLLAACAGSFHLHKRQCQGLRDATLSRILGAFTYFNYQDALLYQTLISELLCRTDKMNPMSCHHLIVGLQRQSSFIADQDWLARAVKKVCNRIATDRGPWTLAQSYGTLNALAKLRVRETGVLTALIRRLVVVASHNGSATAPTPGKTEAGAGAASPLKQPPCWSSGPIGKNLDKPLCSSQQRGKKSSASPEALLLFPNASSASRQSDDEQFRSVEYWNGEINQEPEISCLSAVDVPRSIAQWEVCDAAFAASVLHALDTLDGWNRHSIGLLLISRFLIEPKMHELRCRELINLGLAFRDFRMPAARWRRMKDWLRKVRGDDGLNEEKADEKEQSMQKSPSSRDEQGRETEEEVPVDARTGQGSSVEQDPWEEDWRLDFYHNLVEHLRRHEPYAVGQPDVLERVKLLKAVMIAQLGEPQLESRALDFLTRLEQGVQLSPTGADCSMISATGAEDGRCPVTASSLERVTAGTPTTDEIREEGAQGQDGAEAVRGDVSLLEAEVLCSIEKRRITALPLNTGGTRATAALM